MASPWAPRKGVLHHDWCLSARPAELVKYATHITLPMARASAWRYSDIWSGWSSTRHCNSWRSCALRGCCVGVRSCASSSRHSALPERTQLRDRADMAGRFWWGCEDYVDSSEAIKHGPEQRILDWLLEPTGLAYVAAQAARASWAFHHLVNDTRRQTCVGTCSQAPCVWPVAPGRRAPSRHSRRRFAQLQHHAAQSLEHGR